MTRTGKLRVTGKNVTRMKAIHDSLEANLEELLQQVRKYPVELWFEDYRYLFDNEKDVHLLLEELRAGIAAVRAA